MSSIVVLSGGLIRGGQVEGFGANMHHGPGRDQVGAVVVRSLEHRNKTREARTPFDQSLRKRSFGSRMPTFCHSSAVTGHLPFEPFS